MELLTERHAGQIAGVISCYDRILIQGTFPGLCYAEGMIAYLRTHQVRILDYPPFAEVQRLAVGWRVGKIRQKPDAFARRYCPVIARLGTSSHWSLDQVEYATDIVFRQQADLQVLYDRLTRTAIHSVKPEYVVTFLGKKLHGNYEDELGNRFHLRIQGTRIKRIIGPVALNMYDKFGLTPRIDTSVNGVSFFSHYREVDQRDGTRLTKWTHMKKSLYSLPALRAANRRYLEFLSTLADPSAGVEKLRRLSEIVIEHDRSYRGSNLFAREDQQLLEALARGELNIQSLDIRTLRDHLSEKSSGQVSRLLKRLRSHGFIKKFRRTYRYSLWQGKYRRRSKAQRVGAHSSTCPQRRVVT